MSRRSWAAPLASAWVALLFLFIGVLAADINSDQQALQAFLSGLQTSPRVDWPDTAGVCTWQGVVCSSDQPVRVIILRLPAVGLSGRIATGTLGLLSELRILSLHSNRLSGSLPLDLSNCTQLRSLYLQDNELSGSLPPLSGVSALVRLNLAGNRFSGAIPSSYSSLHRLGTLYLQSNLLSGDLPDFVSTFPHLAQFSLANNSMTGSISSALQQKFGISAFVGNSFCGAPLFDPCPSNTPSPVTNVPPRAGTNNSVHLSAGYIAAIAVGAVALIFFIIACCVVWCVRRRAWSAERGQKEMETIGPPVGSTGKITADESKEEYLSSAAEPEGSKLVFFEGSQYTFDLEDLLRASAEVLGKGSAGTAYKAVLEDGLTVVVKRLKDISVGRKEFEQHMVTLGNLRHRHLVPLRAFYYSKDEKLLLQDYMPLGSLSALLHGSKGSGKAPLDWETRLRIATGAAKGLAFLHEQGGNRFTHGNVKSSNVLLSRNFDASMSDFALTPLFGSSPVASRIVGYRAPEIGSTRKMTQKADVHSFGVVLLELLTGKSPTYTSSEEGVDLPRWVQSVVREEWTSEVFDAELLRYQNIEEEMVQALQIAMACVASSPEQRPTMAQVVKMLEDVHASETDDGNRQSSSDKSKESGGHTPQRATSTDPSTTSRIIP